MKLTKRESILVAVLMALLVFSGCYLFLFKPLRDGLEARKTQYAELDFKKTQMEILLSQPDISVAFEKQLNEAGKNYDSFYATLNSYTIDNIISAMMDDYDLRVTKMDISPYLPVEDMSSQVEMSSSSEESAPVENHLLRCSVELEGGGTFEQIMDFVDAMNKKSFCVSFQDLKIAYATENNLIPDPARFSCTIEIYGIDTPEGIELT